MQSAQDLKNRNNNGVKPLVKTNGQDPSDSPSNDSSTPDINASKKSMLDFTNQNLSMDTADLVDNVLGGFSSSVNSMGRGIVGGFKINNSKINGDNKKGGILQQLIGLVLGIVTLPMRFLNLFKSMTYATAAIGIGIGGIAKSFKRGTTDIYLLIVAILKIIFKYVSCIISFWITTAFGGCIFAHVISLFFVMLRLFIMVIVDFITEKIGLNFTFIVDEVFEFIKWPASIQTLCYTCFGKPVKLRDILSDVGVIEDIGNMITYDFNNTIPRYMKPSIPFGKKSLKSLDKAMN